MNWLPEIKTSTQLSPINKQHRTRASRRSGFSKSQSQSPKGFIRVVCSSQSLERAKQRSQSGISGCGHGWWVVPHGRHVSEPAAAPSEGQLILLSSFPYKPLINGAECFRRQSFGFCVTRYFLRYLKGCSRVSGAGKGRQGRLDWFQLLYHAPTKLTVASRWSHYSLCARVLPILLQIWVSVPHKVRSNLWGRHVFGRFLLCAFEHSLTRRPTATSWIIKTARDAQSSSFCPKAVA